MLPREFTLATERLVLRRWSDTDRDAFAAMNADPEVMRHLPRVFTRPEADAMVDRIEDHFETHGFGLWAVEVREDGALAGFVGLQVPRFEAPFMPCVEIAWRLARAHHGLGIASEAARATLADGFERVDLDEIVSFTTPANEPSWRVMQRIGMHRDPAEDFDHPGLARESHMRRHVLYRILRDEWRSR